MKIILDICEQCKEKYTKTGTYQKYCSYKCFRDSRPNYLRAWRNRSQEFLMLVGAKWRAKRDSIDFNLVKEDIIIPTHCPILGIPIKRNEGSGYHWDSPSLDRIDNNRGYTKDNIRVISNRANLLKSDATLIELEALVEDARNLRS